MQGEEGSTIELESQARQEQLKETFFGPAPTREGKAGEARQ
jgi:hypothetical protein